MDREEVVRSLAELLTIAKVAMPPELHELDPRILRAQDLLAELKGHSSARLLGLPSVPPKDARLPFKGEAD